MANLIDINKKNNALLDRRLIQLNVITIVLAGLMFLSSLILSNNVGSRYLATGIFVLVTLHILRKSVNPILARYIFIWTNALTVSFLLWSTSSTHYAILLPVFILIASLMVNTRAFIIFSTYCVLSIIVFGFIKLNNNIEISFGYWQLIDLIIMSCAAVYTSWQASSDMKHTLRILNKEYKNLTNSHKEIKNLIHFDNLTGLANGVYCKKQYSKLFEKFKANSNEQLAVFFLDLDNFKTINDYYNHSVGDKLLIEVSQRLQGLIGGKDIACRLSGDEFILVISRPKNYNFSLLADRILKRIAKPIVVNSIFIDITASIGLALASEDDNDFDKIRKKSDLAMYQAKEFGKNSFSIYDDKFYQKSLYKLTVVNGLKDALANNGLEVYLQPKVNISTGKVRSAEALIRWTDKNINNISPAEFIPMIESSELICKIGKWVIHNACKQCKEWHDNGYDNLSIAVNVSSSQFGRGELVSIIKKELKKSQLPAEFLELELTEHTVFHDNEDILSELKELKDLGITLSIDDFGTGYSNIEYLTKFNVDLVKIDRSFIKGLETSTEHFAIVTAIINMAKTLGLKVVAEGVETQKEWDVLKKIGCHYGQGFLWSKALSPSKFRRYLAKESSTHLKVTM